MKFPPVLKSSILLGLLPFAVNAQSTSEVVVQDLDKSFVVVPKNSTEATRFRKKPTPPIDLKPTAPQNPVTAKKFQGAALPIRISNPATKPTNQPETTTNEK